MPGIPATWTWRYTAEAIIRWTRPVSYTHLDVYKRQDQHLVSVYFAAGVGIYDGHAQGRERHDLAVFGGQSLDGDVYKRQLGTFFSFREKAMFSYTVMWGYRA